MAEDQEKLSSDADAYFRALPNLTYPQALVDKHPRIANKIAELKDDKVALRDYFNGLTNDTRGKRQGFDFSVLMNIQSVREAVLGDANGFVLDDNTKWVS